MADSVQVAETYDSAASLSLIGQLGELLQQLEAHRDATEDGVQWVEIAEHFRNLERTMKLKFEELEAKEKGYDEKEAQTRTMLADREADVIAKEQDLVDRLQELKDAAVAAIVEARASFPLVEPVGVAENKDSKVSGSLGDLSPLEDYFPPKMGGEVAVDVQPRPPLIQLCQQMDSKGLSSFVMGSKKNQAILKELSVALESATDPALLVLDLLERFYHPVETDHHESTQPMKDVPLWGLHKSHVLCIEAMALLLERVDPGGDNLLNPKLKQQAKAIADWWKSNLISAGLDATSGNSLEAEAFLQLVSTFRIASEFDQEELCKFVVLVTQCKKAPELCRSLGLTHKMPGVVESLVNNGRQIDVVHLIYAFNLTEHFPVVPLLETYLMDVRRNGATMTEDDANAHELAALRAVIRCIEEYKLQAHYSLDPLQRRVAQLKKSTADKRSAGDSGKHPQPKKPKSKGKFRGSHGSAAGGRQPPAIFKDRTSFVGQPTLAATNPYKYQIHSQFVYGQQVPDQSFLYYSQNNQVNSTSYNANPSYRNYSNYTSGGFQSSQESRM